MCIFPRQTLPEAVLHHGGRHPREPAPQAAERAPEPGEPVGPPSPHILPHVFPHLPAFSPISLHSPPPTHILLHQRGTGGFGASSRVSPISAVFARPFIPGHCDLPGWEGSCPKSTAPSPHLAPLYPFPAPIQQLNWVKMQTGVDSLGKNSS